MEQAFPHWGICLPGWAAIRSSPQHLCNVTTEWLWQPLTSLLFSSQSLCARAFCQGLLRLHTQGVQAASGPSACSTSFGVGDKSRSGHCAKAAPSSAPLPSALLCGAAGPLGNCPRAVGTRGAPGMVATGVKTPSKFLHLLRPPPAVEGSGFV